MQTLDDVPDAGAVPLRSSIKRRPIGDAAERFMRRFFPDADCRDWNDWRWQLSHTIDTFEQLSEIIPLREEELGVRHFTTLSPPFCITPYYASLIDPYNPSAPLRRCVIPLIDEHAVSAGESVDPLGEDAQSPVSSIVHRYPDRVLFLVANRCAVYCRYCTRSRIFSGRNCRSWGKRAIEQGIAYIASHREIRDVLLSGGDPLILPDATIEWILSSLRRIPHVEIIRIGTKTPAVLPQRITPHLLKVLRRHHPLFMSLHFTHPDELTPEAHRACAALADAGIPLGSQTVLLKGVNDNAATMRALMQGLLRMRVRPYYLYQCDPIPGSAHFRTPVETGLSIISSLRGHTSGYAVPTYVIDAPGGGGKIPILPASYLSRDEHGVILKNYQGQIYRYPDICDGLQ